MERYLLGGNQVDLKTGAQPGGQVVRQVAREQVIQHADGPQLVGRNLPCGREVVGYDAGLDLLIPNLRTGSPGGLEQGVDLILAQCLFHADSPWPGASGARPTHFVPRQPPPSAKSYPLLNPRTTFRPSNPAPEP